MPQMIDESLAAYASTKDSVRLPDGRIIHMVCMGKGTPVVILSAGAGDWGVIWSKVQPEVAKETRVCTWDRAGFGLSDLPPKPQTVDNTTSDLEAALKADKLDGPYVAVGHSLGGLESLLLADRQPEKVVGMVLVDSTTPARSAQLNQAGPAPTLKPFPDPPLVTLLHKCAAALRAGTVRAGGPDPDGCLRGQTLPPEYPPELRAALDRHPENLPPETLASTMDFLAASASPQLLLQDPRIAVKPDRNYDHMPLIVLTADDIPSFPGQSDADLAKLKAQIRRDHDELAALSTRGANHIVEGSSHYIHRIKPQIVIDSINEVVDEARADMAKSQKPARPRRGQGHDFPTSP
jgi:pimeloyl-ACP methyl ester carboxylesterase